MIVLASQSPRRRELLSLMGLDFSVLVANADESMAPDSPIETEIQKVSLRKAKAVQSQCSADDVIIAADTMVCIGGQRLGKPKDEQDAARMLHLLSDNTHQVISGLCVLQGERAVTTAVVTDLHFRPLSDREIAAYIATGEPMDKAGAYGIQGKAAVFADRLSGDYYNVMGLPVCALTEILRSFGVAVLGD